MTIRLYDYWRSSASFRVRIALNMKGLAYEAVPVNLLDGAQRAPDYVARNAQGLVPMLEVGELRLTQSLAIIDWLDATQPGARLIPSDPAERARALAMSHLIASDIHPVNNLRILNYLKKDLGIEEAARNAWYRHWIVEGFSALETMADPDDPFLGGNAPGIADICLVPQMANAKRFDTPLENFPILSRIDAACTALPPFKAAHPDAVKP